MTVPDVYGEITGYRAWVINQKSGRLSSTGQNAPDWMPGDNEAVCLADLKARWVRKNVNGQLKKVKINWHGLIPEPECDCGFWLLRQPQNVVNHFLGPRPKDMLMFYGFFGSGSTNYIFGEVKGWGRVVSAERGYRVEYARINRLFVPTAGDQKNHVPARLVEQLATKYGVPCEPDARVNKGPEPEATKTERDTYTRSALGVWTPSPAIPTKLTGTA